MVPITVWVKESIRHQLYITPIKEFPFYYFLFFPPPTSFMLLILSLLLSFFALLCLDSLHHHPPQSQPEWIRPHNPALNLERWYQDIMSAGEPHHQSCPPPLPAKSHSSRRPSQVNLSPLFALIYYALLFVLFLISIPDIMFGILIRVGLLASGGDC